MGNQTVVENNLKYVGKTHKISFSLQNKLLCKCLYVYRDEQIYIMVFLLFSSLPSATFLFFLSFLPRNFLNFTSQEGLITVTVDPHSHGYSQPPPLGGHCPLPPWIFWHWPSLEEKSKYYRRQNNSTSLFGRLSNGH